MNHFLINPWVLIAAGVLWIASLGAVGKWQNDAGHVAERVHWQEKENTELAAANAKILELNAAARRTEQQTAAEIAAIGENHARDQDAAEIRRRNDVAAARSGAFKLHVAGACPARPGGGGAPEATAAGGGSDDGTTAELPGQVTADLLELADDADQVVEQLASCQATVRAYYRASNGEPLPVPNFQKEQES